MAAKSALIIDDEPDVTTYHGTVLSDHGWQVFTANRGADGIAIAREKVPSVILLDVMMPEKGGLSTLIALRKDERTKAIPVVLVTGIQANLTADFEAFLGRFKTYNPDGYVEKPIDPDALLATLDELI
ncbi:MAG: response regulator [Thermoanaerobaculales bacterium]|jgi:twitching motility two-component system response regulator PilH|nr:response regulator [Thermoanaerobaculales bacterium]